MWANNSRFWKYKVYAVNCRDSSGRGRQTIVRLSEFVVFEREFL